jgi:DNA-binding response OmpR family regulator
MPRILIVEDEEQMGIALKDNFEFEGYDVSLANDGEIGLKLATKESFDLMLLDVMLPKVSGFDICQAVRKEGITTPVIMLTARSTDYDKVRGFDLGADDYVTKPFSLIELLARIKAVLRRGGALQSKTGVNELTNIELGKLKIDFVTYIATVDNKNVKMSHTEIEILRHLWEHRNQIVKREDIMKHVYGIEGDISSRSIDNFIVKLRQKIEEDAADPKIIITVHGLGYKLITNII